jgi:hypothetical protein
VAKRKVFEAVINAAQEIRKLGGTQAERMARAAEQGYDTSKVYYHGTRSATESGYAPDIKDFHTTKYGAAEGVYLSPDPKDVNRYASSPIYPGGTIYPTYVKGNIGSRQDMLDAAGMNSTEKTASMAALGLDGYFDEVHRELVMFDPKNIRSINADFNPEYKDSSNLLAGIAGVMPYAGATALGLAGATSSQEAEAGPLQSLGRAAPYLTSAALGGAAALQSGDAEAGRLDALGRAAPYLATGALGAAMMTPQDAQAEPISIMPPTYSDTMQRTQAAINKIGEFQAKRAGKRGAMDIMKLELQTLLKGANEVANDVIFPALDKPLQGYLGLSEVFGSLAQGRGFDTAMQRGAQVAAQPVDATTYNIGGTVTDTLSPYVPAPVAAGAGALTHAGALLASPF